MSIHAAGEGSISIVDPSGNVVATVTVDDGSVAVADRAVLRCLGNIEELLQSIDARLERMESET